MTIRSKLFATVALPVLSLSIAIQPALADSLMRPFEVAQQEGTVENGGEVAPEELPRKRRQQAEQEQSEDAQPAQEQEQQPSRAERRKQRQAEEQQSQEAQPAEEQQEPSREERRKQRQAEQQQEEAQPSNDAGENSAAEERLKKREERRKRQAEQQNATEQPAAEQAQPTNDAGENTAAEERLKKREERRKRQAEQQNENEQPAAEQAKPSDDGGADKAAEERLKKREERRKRQAEQQKQNEQPTAEQAEPSENQQPSGDDEAAKAAEERAKIRAERRKQRQAEQEQGEQPAADGDLRPAIDGEAAEPVRRRPDRRQPTPEIVDTRSEEQKEELARDPSGSDETVVLPVDNGAAVLDSDKDADNSDGDAREKRRALRERARAENENVEIPKSDADSQRSRRDRRPSRDELDAANREEGRRVERVPEFGVNDLIDAFTGNDRRPRVEEMRDNRVVLDFGDQLIVRGDDRPRLRRNAEETFYEELPRGRHRETIERPNGVRIVTIYNQYGDIVQRTRVNRDGEEFLMIYAPEADEGPRPPAYDVGDDLPPMRLQVPVRDYIIDTSSQPDRDYYEFLAEPPVEQVERTYSIDEVRNSARVRDKVRRIDLDTITFATGSAEVPLSQAKTLRKVADAMLQVIDKDPGETFFIEGHTDAVGGDQPNLVLSDERAESVASLLTEVYEIPAENLVTQGYGERFLKVRTEGAEQENRRVTIRRVTPLVRPVAQK